MNEFKQPPLNKYLGFYRGIVTSTSDTTQRGRVQINIYGVFDGISAAALPWAKPALPVFRGAGTGVGYFAVPIVGAHVWCFFEAGDIYQPVYFAEASDGTHGLPSERTTNYPNRVIWKTTSGIVLYIDDAAEEIKLAHPAGTSLTINSAGDVTLTSSGDVIIEGTTVSINP